MTTNENLKTLKIYPSKNYYSIIGFIILFFTLLIVSIISLILAIKAEWNTIYIFLIVSIIAQIFLFKEIIWKLKGYWKIEIDKSEIIIEKNFALFKTKKVYKFDVQNCTSLKNFHNLQFIKFFPLGKLYLDIIAKIDSGSWSIILENSEKTTINNLSENQAIEILNFIKRK